MKNKSVVIKILIGGGFLLFLLLLIVIFSFIKMAMPKSEDKIVKEIITNTYSLEDVENISFDFKKSNLDIKTSDNDDLIIVQNSEESKFYLNYKKKGKKVSFEEDGYLINPQKKKYNVYIPRKYLNKITIINGFGEISVTEIVNNLDINNNSGKITLENIGNAKIKDVSGEVSINNIIGDINISSSTGDISISNISGNINAESITGNISINRFYSTGDSYFENVSGDINIIMDESAICSINYYNENGKTKIDSKVCNGNTNIVNAKNITGEINIY